MHIYVLLQQFFDIDVFSLPSFSGHLLMRVIFCEEKKSHLTSTSVKVIMASLNNKHIQIATTLEMYHYFAIYLDLSLMLPHTFICDASLCLVVHARQGQV